MEMPFSVILVINNNEQLLKISGDFRSGNTFEKFVQYASGLVMAYKEQLTIVLEDVIFMDLNSMHFINKANYLGCSIVFPKDSYVTERYKSKFY